MTERVQGALKSTIDLRDYSIQAVSVPQEHEIDISRIRVIDQGSVGACVACATTAASEYYDYAQTSVPDVFSPAFVYGLKEKEDSPGMSIREAVQNAVKYGFIPLKALPNLYEVPKAVDQLREKLKDPEFEKIVTEQAPENRFTGYVKLSNLGELKTAIAEDVPVLVAYKWYTPVYVDSPSNHLRFGKTENGRHCLLCYGYNSEGLLIRNSWGIRWGSKGNCIIPYETPFDEAWAVYDDIGEEKLKPMPKTNSDFWKKVLKIISTIINVIIRRN
jgi:hypothetical protein